MLDDAHHPGGGKAAGEHLADGLGALDRLLRHLMVHRARVIEGGQRLNVGAVEGVDPGGDKLPWAHGGADGGLSLHWQASEARSLDETGEIV